MEPGSLWWTNVLNSALPPQRHRPDSWLEHQDPVIHTSKNKREKERRRKEREKERKREREREGGREGGREKGRKNERKKKEKIGRAHV